MATRLLSSHRCYLIHHTRGLRFSYAFSHRLFSHNSSESVNSLSPSPDPARYRVNIHDGIFGPEDSRLPLPGKIGHSAQLNPNLIKESEINPLEGIKAFCDNPLEVLDTHVEAKTISFMMDSPQLEPFPLQVKIQKCPKLLKKDFQTLFPSLNLKQTELSVVTFCHKTQNDMSTWSEAVEEEREAHIKQFIESAKEWCSTLSQEGYWADFIDPSSGRPFLGSFTNFTLFETDERYRHLGFVIDDLGCCKVITHKTWGAHIFVGALFTDAPPNSELFDDLCKKETSQS